MRISSFDCEILRSAQDDTLFVFMTLSRVIEALLFRAQKPLSAKEIVHVINRSGEADELLPNEFANVREADVAAALEQLKVEYIEHQHAFQLVEKAEGWKRASNPSYTQR